MQQICIPCRTGCEKHDGSSGTVSPDWPNWYHNCNEDLARKAKTAEDKLSLEVRSLGKHKASLTTHKWHGWEFNSDPCCWGMSPWQIITQATEAWDHHFWNHEQGMISFPDNKPDELGVGVELPLPGMAAVNTSPSMLIPSQWGSVRSCSAQLQYLISNLHPLNPITMPNSPVIASPPSTIKHSITPTLLDAYWSLLPFSFLPSSFFKYAYLAHITNVTRFSIATPFVILVFIMLSLFRICTDHPLV